MRWATNQERVDKQTLFFRGYFVSKKMRLSVKAMNTALIYHTGKRRDGKPEISHQFEMVGYVLQVLGERKRITSKFLDEVIAATFLHDLPEDYPEQYPLEMVKDNFNGRVYELVEYMTKTWKGYNKTKLAAYYKKMSCDPIAVILKGIDRLHNITTALEGMKKEGVMKYVNEVETHFYPMLKTARINFSQYYFVFINISNSLERQIHLINKLIEKLPPIEEIS